MKALSSRELSESPNGAPTQPAPTRRSVVLGIIVTVVLAGGSLGVLFYRAVARPQPSRVIVVRGNPEWDGLELVVSGSNLGMPQTTKFEQLGNFIVPFFLTPGKYTLQIKNQEVPIFRKDIDLTQIAVEDIDLIHLGATTQPATQPTMASATSQPATTRSSDRQ